MGRLSKEDVVAFFDRLAPYWDDEIIIDERKIETILDAAGVKVGSRVLDVACGTGVLFPFYARRGVEHVAAVDISSEMIKIAQSKTNDPRFQILCADIESLEGTGDYDCCVIYNAFPHFSEPERLITMLSDWLKPGGRLTVAHSMSIDELNQHHAASAASVSRRMLLLSDMIALFERRFYVDTAVSDDEKYIVSGTLLPRGYNDL